jgi:beta-lactamase superfamily II metal-dependent hydrolase
MTAVIVRALPAKCGDCLVIEYGSAGDRPYRILIDGGLKGSYADGLGKYLAESNDQPTEFDIVVVSHIDLDHIAGVIMALEENQLTTENIWFNGRDQLVDLIDADRGTRGHRQGDALDKLIPNRKRNPVVGGKAIHVPETGALELEGMPGTARCTLLSPSRDRLERLLKKWPEPTRGDPIADLFDAFDDDTHAAGTGTRAAGVFGKDGSAANGSSNAFLLEIDDVKLLLTGDAYAKELEATIKQVLERRGEEKLSVDLFKLSHHGSRQNMTDDLLRLIDPAKILICTDGSKFKHPDADALQKIREHYPDVPIHFTDNTEVIAERAGSIGLDAPSADQLPVELNFGDAPLAEVQTTTMPPPSAGVVRKEKVVKMRNTHAGPNGVKVREDNLNVRLEWGASATTRGGTAVDDMSMRLAQHETTKEGSVSFEVVAEATVREVEQTNRRSRGATAAETGQVVVELGRPDGDEQRIVLVEENGQFGWFLPEQNSDEVCLPATLGAPGSRGRVTSLVRRKLRVIAIKGMQKAIGTATNAAVGAYEQRCNPPGSIESSHRICSFWWLPVGCIPSRATALARNRVGSCSHLLPKWAAIMR